MGLRFKHLDFKGISSIQKPLENLAWVVYIVPRSFMYLSSIYLKYKKNMELNIIKEARSNIRKRSMFYNIKRYHLI